jgi:hypothetical protein
VVEVVCKKRKCRDDKMAVKDLYDNIKRNYEDIEKQNNEKK